MKKTLVLVLLVGSLAMAVYGRVEDSDNISPVPEPATIGLMGAGIAAIGFAAWRKNRKK